MNIAVDIGNSNLKCGFFLPGEGWIVLSHPIPMGKFRFTDWFISHLSKWDAFRNESVTWGVAQTGNFPWKRAQAEILKVRPQDQFEILIHRHIPVKIDVEFPEKVGIDRLLAAYSAIDQFGQTPMLIVDAGTAMTVDVVQNQTFCGGAILPGMNALSKIYPHISEKLPLLSIADYSESGGIPPSYPGKNTETAIENGIYWGTIGTILQFYHMLLSKEDVLLILTGGNAEYLLPGLTRVIPSKRIRCNFPFVLEGIRLCFENKNPA